jgi:hypothetical protein
MKRTMLVAALLLPGITGLSQNPPQPLEIANTVSNLWFSNNLAGLSAYATSLYSGTATNYLPAIMVSMFHDRVFTGKPLTASNKIGRVASHIETTPQSFPDGFKHFVSVLTDMTNRPAGRALTQGINPDAIPVTPQILRDNMGGFMIPDIAVLYEIPALSLP